MAAPDHGALPLPQGREAGPGGGRGAWGTDYPLTRKKQA